MPSLTTVALNKEYTFNYKETVKTKSSPSSSPLSLDISPALSDYLSFPPSFTHTSLPLLIMLCKPPSPLMANKDITVKDCSGINPRNAPLHPHDV